MPTYNTILRMIRELTENGMSMSKAIHLVSNSYGIPYSVVNELVNDNK